MTKTVDEPVYTTTGTVSSPLNLAEPQGEHVSVSLNGGRKKIKPQPKATLTSLTPHNVCPTPSLLT